MKFVGFGRRGGREGGCRGRRLFSSELFGLFGFIIVYSGLFLFFVISFVRLFSGYLRKRVRRRGVLRKVSGFI